MPNALENIDSASDLVDLVASFLDLPFDLSKVFFVGSANALATAFYSIASLNAAEA